MVKCIPHGNLSNINLNAFVNANTPSAASSFIVFLIVSRLRNISDTSGIGLLTFTAVFHTVLTNF